MDAFSEILGSVQLRGAIFFNAEFSAPWCIASSGSDNLAPYVAAETDHIIVYHLLLKGHAYTELPGGLRLDLSEGDIVIYPRSAPHLLACGRASITLNDDIVIERVRNRDLGPLQLGGGGEVAHFVCGFMACDQDLCQPILAGLPAAFKVNIREGASGAWMENSIRHLVEEAQASHPGSEAILAKLSEALFIDALRLYVGSLPDAERGWLAAARDPLVAKTLMILHSRAGEAWTIADLAREVGISRSSLVERFSRCVGEPPMSYLTKWRLRLAARRLVSSGQSVGEIAAEVGYESEASFSRAFRKMFGLPPARYRREKANGRERSL